MLARGIALGAAILGVSGCAADRNRSVEFPSNEWIADMDAFATDAPDAMQVGEKRYAIEFGSRAEVRNVECRWLRPGKSAKCRYERRVQPAFGEFGPWEATTNEFERARGGKWQATIPFPQTADERERR
ncbi:MAG: hypothetical protein QOJ91_2062 [Sphingomonadales bacterium]|jgi:hypothetical protein|nr:hypothetical protein [Sphingomonadales bacterium]